MKNNLVNQDIKTDKPVPMSYEALKAKCDALAVENAALIEGLRCIYTTALIAQDSGPEILYSWDFANQPAEEIEMWISDAKETDAALADIEARFCGLLDTYGKVEPERFNPEFADLYAKIVNRIFSSVMDNPSVTDLESLTDYLDSSAENARAYADMSMKFHAELREAK